jgi:predicted nuclease with TOPRIM domain
VNTSLALYEALLQANVSAPAARRAAEALEADMTQHLATKQDLAHTNALMAKGFEAVNQRFNAVDHRFASIDKRFDAVDHRFASIDKRFDALDKILEVRFAALKAEVGATQTELEGRLLKKLSAIMTFLLAAMMGLQAILR